MFKLDGIAFCRAIVNVSVQGEDTWVFLINFSDQQDS